MCQEWALRGRTVVAGDSGAPTTPPAPAGAALPLIKPAGRGRSPQQSTRNGWNRVHARPVFSSRYGSTVMGAARARAMRVVWTATVSEQRLTEMMQRTDNEDIDKLKDDDDNDG